MENQCQCAWLTVLEDFLAMGGRLTLSDDSHGVEQVGTNYVKGFEYLENLGVEELWFLGARSGLGDATAEAPLKSVKLAKVKETFR